jgi:hypothetical protein
VKLRHPGREPRSADPYGFVAYDQIDSGLNQTGPFLASLAGLDRIENWADLTSEAKRTGKERWMDRIIADLDRQYPGIAGAIVQRENVDRGDLSALSQHAGRCFVLIPESRGFMLLARRQPAACTSPQRSPAGAVFLQASFSVGVGGKPSREI